MEEEERRERKKSRRERKLREKERKENVIISDEATRNEVYTSQFVGSVRCGYGIGALDQRINFGIELDKENNSDADLVVPVSDFGYDAALGFAQHPEINFTSQLITKQHSSTTHSTAQQSTAQHSTAQHTTAHHSPPLINTSHLT